MLTDGQAMAIARRLDAMNWKMWQLAETLKDHPNGEKLIDDMKNQGWMNPSDSTNIVADNLVNPEQWEKQGMEWVHKRAAKAGASRG